MEKPSGEELVKRFEVREKRHAQTAIGLGVVLSMALLAFAWRSTHEVAVKQAMVDTLETKYASIAAVNDSLARAVTRRDSSIGLANTGASLAMQGRVSDASANYRAAIEVDSTNWVAWDLYGTLYRRTNPRKAIPLLRRGISLNQSNVWAFYNLSIALWNVGDREAALDSLERVVELAAEMRETIRRDEQFTPFRSSERFRALVGK